MGNFSSIKDAIFGSEAQAQEAPPATSTPGSGGFSRADTKGEAISEVDVEAKLDSMPGADKLNWRTSIVDLPLVERPGSHLVRVIAWYDNEWGYASRIAELLGIWAQEES